jgi:uncharacterized Zn finger protein (UPF0148 family)
VDKQEILHCPRCGEVMIHDQKMGFWKCPNCGGEWWDDESKLALIREEEADRARFSDERQRILWSLSRCYNNPLPPIPIRDYRSSGSRSSGRKRKKPLPKLLHSERYILA